MVLLIVHRRFWWVGVLIGVVLHVLFDMRTDSHASSRRYFGYHAAAKAHSVGLEPAAF
jgi:hypothetical protein